MTHRVTKKTTRQRSKRSPQPTEEAARLFAKAILRKVLTAHGATPDALKALPTLDELLGDKIGLPDEVVRMRHLLSPESDRGCVLIAAAYLDDELATLLRKNFVNQGALADRLLAPDRPLGSFSARIDACEALGLLPAGTCRDLHLLRKMRNDFAHRWEDLSFEESPIRERCGELSTKRADGLAGRRSRFTGAVMAITASIHFAQGEAIPRQPPVPATTNDGLRAKNQHFLALVMKILKEELLPT